MIFQLMETQYILFIFFKSVRVTIRKVKLKIHGGSSQKMRHEKYEAKLDSFLVQTLFPQVVLPLAGMR